jgi:hypothetical protein
MTETTIQGGRTGPSTASDGGTAANRLGKRGESIIAQGVGSRYESASRGEIFIASTAVAGVAPGTALSTTPPLALHNPEGSGVLLSILDVYVSYVSGTLGAGSIVHARTPQTTVPTGGTDLTILGAKLGDTAGKATAGQGHTVSATPTLLRGSGITLGASLATTAALPVLMHENVDGGIVVPENNAYIIEGVAAAGSTPLVIISVVFQEIPQA